MKKLICYIDKEGLLHPSATTKSVKRFYTKQDIVNLHQILSMKYLGFSLEDIKNRMTTLTTPQNMAQALELQKQLLKEQIANLLQALSATEVLIQETVQMKSVCLIIDPLYLSLLCGFFGGGDINGIVTGFGVSEVLARVIFGVVLVVNVIIMFKYDGEYYYGKKRWMPERFCYSQALLI